jgi:ubiquitin carboxyl-terminal hydrolase 10
MANWLTFKVVDIVPCLDTVAYVVLQVFLFGSFTEDETKLFQGQPLTSPTKSVSKPCELPGIQFGSLDLSVLSLPNTYQPITQCVVLPAKSIDGQARVVTKDTACSNKQETVRSSLPNGGPLLANGCPRANASPNNGELFEDIKKTEAVVPSSVAVKSTSNSAPNTASEVHKDGTKSTQNSNLNNEIIGNGNAIIDEHSVVAPAVEEVTNLNKKSFPSMPLLPHGLKNTGNICFLNATLQALLSCLPFVHLLQELRNRSISKVRQPKKRSVCYNFGACFFAFVVTGYFISGRLSNIECIC